MHLRILGGVQAPHAPSKSASGNMYIFITMNSNNKSNSRMYYEMKKKYHNVGTVPKSE
jgi:hypothetical protein